MLWLVLQWFINGMREMLWEYMNMAKHCWNAVAGVPMVEKWSEEDSVGI